LVNVK